MLTTVVCEQTLSRMLCELNFISPGHYPNAQISQEFLGNPGILEF